MKPVPTRRVSTLVARLLPVVLLALSACGGGSETATVVDNGGNTYQVLAGQVEKGPLMRGSTVTINTLTPAAASLAASSTTTLANTTVLGLPALVPTGASFTMEVKDDFGSFTPQSAAIFQSAFIETNAEGYYLNELTGQRSDDYIALRGLSNLKSDKAINVNVLTDMAKERTLVLARAAAAAASAAPGTVTPALFDAARRQAQTETLRAFGIDSRDLGTVAAFSEMDLKKISTEVTPRAADNILLALSSLVVQTGQDGSGVVDFLNRFETDLADNGVIDDAALKAAILKASAAVDFDRVAANMNTFYKTTRYVGADIAQWVDRSGGVLGLLQKNVQYLPNLMYSSGTVYDSRAYTLAAGSAAACYGAEMNDAANGSAQLLDASAATAVVQTGPKIYPISATAAATMKLRFTPTSPNAVAFLMRWDAVAGACSATSQPSKTKLLAYAALPTDVGLFLNKYMADFTRCFNLPVTSRVLAVDNTVPTWRGGPSVTAVAAECQPLVSAAGRTGIEYLSNGYIAGQAFYAMLTDTSLTKSVSVKNVSILRSSSAAAAPMAPLPALVFNLTYADRYGRLGNTIQVAQKVAGSSAASGDWWVTGNQQQVDVNVLPQVRKFTSIASFTTATPSIKEQYRSYIGFFVNATGPGTRLTDGTPLTAVRVSGSGLPGLVYIPPVQPGQAWMDLSNASGDVAGASARRCGSLLSAAAPVWTDCPNYAIARTTTVVPSAAALVKRLPTSTEGSCATAASVNQACAWGWNWSPADITAQLTLNAAFTLEFFYGGQVTPTYTYVKYLNSSLPDVTRLANAGWATLDSASVLAARPLAGQTSLALTWTGLVPNAVEVKTASVTLNSPTAMLSEPADTVARGSASTVLLPDGEIQYAAPSVNPSATNLRSLQWSLRTWDGSARSQWFSYDTAN